MCKAPMLVSVRPQPALNCGDQYWARSENALFVGMGARAAAAPELASSSVFGRVRRGSDHEFGSLIQLRPRRHGFLPKRPALARSLLSERVAIDPEAAASVPRSVQGGFGRLFPGPNLHHPFRRRALLLGR